MAEYSYDFSGWATKYDYGCSDGRVIRHNAFRANHGKKVPLMWMHQHSEIGNVIGNAVLEHRDGEGVYMYGSLNHTEEGETARELLAHGDVTSLSVYANKLKETNKNVFSGDIKEVSLVIAGANPGAHIEHVMVHSDEAGEPYFEATINFELDDQVMVHAESGIVDIQPLPEEKTNEPVEELVADDNAALTHADGDEIDENMSAEDVLKTMNEAQLLVVSHLLDKQQEKFNKEAKEMAHSLFENTVEAGYQAAPAITTEEMTAILEHAQKPGVGSLKAAVMDFLHMNEIANQDALEHADDDDAQSYGITNIEILFPDAKGFTNTPEFIKRRTEWVNKVMTGTRKSPFAKFKSLFADITADEARAKGYTKGNRKIEEVFSVLKRETGPTTIYKKQKIDRDDVLDITDFNVVLFLKGEMRLMWEEEAARAVLIGDGRDALSPDKIKENKIRPIWKDDVLYTIPERVTLSSTELDEDHADQRTKKIIRKIVKSRKDYRGSGNPTFFTTEDFLSDCLLLEDGLGHPMYDTVEKLATALRVSSIVTVPVMENQTRTVSIEGTDTTVYLVGLVVNLSDYNIGADKGGEAQMFDDFNIDYNQYIYLYEGRMSGALIKPQSALAIEYSVATAQQSSETPAG